MILVTGGAGFIGSVLVQLLNERGHEDIIIVDRLRSGEKWKNLLGVKYSEFIHADELFSPDYEGYLSRVDEIYHMGACSKTTETDVDFLMKNNWEFSKKLFLFSVHNSLKFCYASSAATYGGGEHGYDDTHEGVNKLRPLNAYGYSKQFFDQWLLSQKRHPKFWYGIKFFNVYGPNEYHKDDMTSVVYKAWEQIKDSGEVKLFKSHRDDFKDGEQKRDFVYVKDVCEAMIQLMNLDGQGSESEFSGIYNMGTGKSRTFKDLVSATFKALDKPEKINYIDMPEKLRGQYQYFTQANMSKLSKALPSFQFHTLEAGVNDYVSNYLERENQYVGYYGKD